MEFRVIQRFMRISPFKTRKVADLVRGKRVEDALAVLKFLPRRASGILEKAIRSAVANAEQSEQAAAIEDLFVKTIMVDEGPTMKRFHYRAQGRVFKVRKRMSHIIVVLEEMAQKTIQSGKPSKA